MLTETMPEELVTLIHAISEDEELSEWLLRLEQLPEDAREAELLLIAARMRSNGEEADVVDSVSLLAQPEFYAAACQSLRELRP